MDAQPSFRWPVWLYKNGGLIQSRISFYELPVMDGVELFG